MKTRILDGDGVSPEPVNDRDTPVASSADGVSPRPRLKLHQAVGEYVRRLISALPPGSLLPTEVELARRTGSSRMTVRQALAELQQGGHVRRVIGVGTFTTDAKTRSQLPSLENYLDDWMAQGHDLAVRVVSYKVEPVPSRQAQLLGEDTAYHLVRLRSVDREPLAIDNRWLLREIGDLISVKELTAQPIHRIITQGLHLEITALELSIAAGICTPAEARWLKTPEGSAVLYRRMTLFGRRDRVLGVGDSTYRADRFEFTTRVIAPG